MSRDSIADMVQLSEKRSNFTVHAPLLPDLGRETFCISKELARIGMPYHHIFFDHKTAMKFVCPTPTNPKMEILAHKCLKSCH